MVNSMAMSDKIESFIIELLKEETSPWLELGRNELAGIFNCVPSQINYVLATRFSPEKGYLVESRRGGGGYIRIRREVQDLFDVEELLKSIGGSVSEEKAVKILDYLSATGRIDRKVRSAAEASLLGGVLPNAALRATILKRIIKSVI